MSQFYQEVQRIQGLMSDMLTALEQAPDKQMSAAELSNIVTNAGYTYCDFVNITRALSGAGYVCFNVISGVVFRLELPRPVHLQAGYHLKVVAVDTVLTKGA